MSTTDVALTAHLVFPTGYPGEAIRNELSKELREHFKISHVTIRSKSAIPGKTVRWRLTMLCNRIQNTERYAGP